MFLVSLDKNFFCAAHWKRIGETLPMSTAKKKFNKKLEKFTLSGFRLIWISSYLRDWINRIHCPKQEEVSRVCIFFVRLIYS